MSNALDRWFGLSAAGTSVRTEVVAGGTTFLTMAYIMFVHPSILGAAGMDQGAVFVATCLASAFGCLVMGLLANYPVALAPGMGLNAYFAFTVCGNMGYSWQVALGATFISGILFVALSAAKVRTYLIDGIPSSLKHSIAAGIGLFLGIIGLKNAGFTVDDPATLVTLGDMTKGPVILAAIGLAVMTALFAMRIPGAIMIAILGVSGLGFVVGASDIDFSVSLPPSMGPTFLEMDLVGALSGGMASVIFVFLFVDLFDTSGTLVGLAQRAGMLNKEGRLPRSSRALMADSSATVLGAALGTSTTTSYIESAAGIQAGGRTGLVAVTVAGLFLLSLFIAPLATSIPGYATAPALIFVACMMAGGLRDVDWKDVTEYVPAVVTALFMPFTFSIANGIGAGFIAYAAIKLLSGRYRELNLAIVAVAILAALKFAYYS
ncbi:MAG: NCS2 family permease [Proteobacteria bacterium]|nr:NCS2 family permease [Pseudomonadota bacterium]